MNREQVPIDYVPIQHDEYFYQTTVSCYPVQTQASKQGDNVELEDGDLTRQLPDYDKQTSNSQASSGYVCM